MTDPAFTFGSTLLRLQLLFGQTAAGECFFDHLANSIGSLKGFTSKSDYTECAIYRPGRSENLRYALKASLREVWIIHFLLNLD